MKRNKISEIIGNISEEYVTEAIEYNKKKYTYKKRIVWGAIAACFILIITFGSMLIKDVLPGSESEKIVVHNDEETIIFEKSDSIGITQSDMAFTFKEKFRIISKKESNLLFGTLDFKGNVLFNMDSSKAVHIEGDIDNVKLIVAAPGIPVSDTVIEGEETNSTLDGVPINAGYFITDKNSKGKRNIIYYATFKLDENTLYVENAGSEDNSESIRNEIVEVIEKLVKLKEIKLDKIEP